ncbi:hypothetical protein PC116_g9789 [Phytophthora cactorum]|uniref:Uncharacterized protein n=1 Tax=Phytophthora cactorum TaxID=29920 RepID=A0A8T1DYG4_9STRA|nr:hypothetical protein Pcac1_g12960 [Phytophthora cactorum]KAG2807237.1 hypothetical protein PC111_g17007 [Phytophthora cactorum]KAG2833318.1 hypothetical protein PC112_g6549 [Phytophthora cactorum]KAG2859344.1 hypothetical protein PC113_g9010 [Phytophthora cactorum]KAG2885523.1 hypothetical protein PC114_g19636 [Phytophthora cactorum]
MCSTSNGTGRRTATSVHHKLSFLVVQPKNKETPERRFSKLLFSLGSPVFRIELKRIRARPAVLFLRSLRYSSSNRDRYRKRLIGPVPPNLGRRQQTDTGKPPCRRTIFRENPPTFGLPTDYFRKCTH